MPDLSKIHRYTMLYMYDSYQVVWNLKGSATGLNFNWLSSVLNPQLLPQLLLLTLLQVHQAGLKSARWALLYNLFITSFNF